MSNDLSDIEWVRYDPSSRTERRFAANDPDGNPDVANRPMRTFYRILGIQHNDDGTHGTTNQLILEQGSYTGNATDDRVISLTNTNLLIKLILISGRIAKYPVFCSSIMTADNTKLLGSAAFAADLIQAIDTAGQFTIGADDTVNKNTETFDYVVFGTGAPTP
jgi:hypothetical protein